MKYIEILRKLRVDVRNFSAVYSATIGRSFALQARFEKKLREVEKFSLSLNDLTMKLGDNSYAIQYLGFETIEDIWVWGWHEKTELPKELFDFCELIKDFSEVHFMDYAKNTNYKIIDKEFAKNLTATICSMFDDYISHPIPMEKGKMYLAVVPSDDMLGKCSMHEFLSITTHCLKNLKVHDRLVVEGFLLWNEVEYEKTDDTIIAKFEKDVVITFGKVEEVERVLNIQVVEK